MMLDYFKVQIATAPVLCQTVITQMVERRAKDGAPIMSLIDRVGDTQLFYILYEENVHAMKSTFRRDLEGKSVVDFLGQGYYFDGHQGNLPAFRKH